MFQVDAQKGMPKTAALCAAVFDLFMILNSVPFSTPQWRFKVGWKRSLGRPYMTFNETKPLYVLVAQ